MQIKILSETYVRCCMENISYCRFIRVQLHLNVTVVNGKSNAKHSNPFELFTIQSYEPYDDISFDSYASLTYTNPFSIARILSNGIDVLQITRRVN